MSGAVLDLRGAVPDVAPDAARTARGLVVSESGLTALPAWIGELARLRMLDAAHNSLTAVPAFVGDLRALEVLYLGDNRLTALPRPSARCAP